METDVTTPSTLTISVLPNSSLNEAIGAPLGVGAEDSSDEENRAPIYDLVVVCGVVGRRRLGWGLSPLGGGREGHDDDKEEGKLGEYTSWSRADCLSNGSTDVASVLRQLYSAGRHDGQRRYTTAPAARSGVAFENEPSIQSAISCDSEVARTFFLHGVGERRGLAVVASRSHRAKQNLPSDGRSEKDRSGCVVCRSKPEINPSQKREDLLFSRLPSSPLSGFARLFLKGTG